MGWFENLKTSGKLLVGFGAMCGMLLGVSGMAYQALTAIQSNERDEIDPSKDAERVALEFRAMQNRNRANMLELLTSDDPVHRAELESRIDEDSKAISLDLARLKTFTTSRGLANEVALIAKAEEDISAYRGVRAEELRLLAAGKNADARQLVGGAQSERSERIRQTLIAVGEGLTTHSKALAAESSRVTAEAVRRMAAVAIVAVLFALFMIWLMNRLIAAPLARTVRMIQEMSQGRLDTRLKMNRNDEVGLLASAMDQLADTVNALVVDADVLSKAAVAGKLATRADASKHQGDFRKIMQGVNDTLDALIGPLNVAARYVERIAQNDVPLPIADKYNGDFDVLNKNLNKMVDNLRGLNEELRGGFGVLASSSTEILATALQVATSMTETATAVSETSTTAEEVKQTAHLSNQKAKAVQETAQKTAAVSETGRKAVGETLEGMNRIREQMESIAESVVFLAERGQTIGEIIATVNDLAEQSNLLAVNAAIEATRAGEYGRGFGVVAQEVKSLAEQSRQATTLVRTILMDVQKATSAAVMATEQGTKAVAAGVKQATDAGDSIRVLTSSVGESAQAATQIAASSQQQLLGMDQIASAIANIRQATTENMAGSRQLEASARSLQELGGRLKVLVERQRLEV